MLIAACAAPKAASMQSAAAPAAAQPSAPLSHVERLAERFRCERVRFLGWPVREALPQPEASYDAAFLFEDHAADGWSYDLLVDRARPRVLWVRRTGTIVGGVVSYLGSAEIVDDAGPLVLRVGPR